MSHQISPPTPNTDGIIRAGAVDILNPAELDRDATAAWPPASRWRKLLKQVRSRLRQAFDEGTDPGILVSTQAAVVDQILTRCWAHFLDTTAHQLALAAVGGYGRGELHPCSDIDILVLVPAEAPDNWAPAVEAFITYLWDTGLEVGHSVRTVEQCAGAAANDITVVTNLTEARLLGGSEHLFEAMRAAISPRRMWPSTEFFEAKKAEQETRHRKFHDTGYQLEPNVKESPGGLRDIQVIAWVAKRHFQADTLSELVDHGFLTPREYQSLQASQAFLWRVRFALHLLTGRREDRLLFDYQVKLAEMFGFTDQDHNLAVEQFMQTYYRTVTRISRLNELLLQLFQETIVVPDQDAPPTPINARFRSCQGFIEVTHPDVFKHYPYALLEMFLLLAEDPNLKGVRASTIRLVRAHRNLIDDHFRADIRARSLFMALLRQPHGITHELRRMSRYGILARYIPAFGRVVGRMQFDLFHVYTVDQHVLFVVRNLRRFALPEFEHEYPLCSQIGARIPKQELLYIAGLFHDIGKGRGGDHSELGAVDAEDFCRRHDLSERDTQLVTWLVQEHLLMSMTAQRRDISDPREIHEFARKVRTQNRLDHLFLLTVADMRGTNPGLLSGWKYRLLTQLYHATAEALQRGLENPLDAAEVIKENRAEALTLLRQNDLEVPDIEACWANFPPEYFLRHQGDEIAWETRAIMAANHDPTPLVQIRPDAERGGTSIFLYLPDRDYLFGAVTGTLNQLGLTVQDARISSTWNGKALDTYLVLEEDGRMVSERFRIAEIREALIRELAKSTTGQSQVTRPPPRRVRAFTTPTQVRFRPANGHPHLALELITGDRPGLLSIVGRVFQENGIRLHAAKVATIGERAEDVFWISSRDGDIQAQPQLQHQLREALVKALDEAGAEARS
ncbi:MAG: [protein-PII] uridylyltransferase [Pseudomonadota bacterium]|nr:[protein-PII] uridylyltransferase [Pseudomonadota bacterium]